MMLESDEVRSVRKRSCRIWVIAIAERTKIDYCFVAGGGKRGKDDRLVYRGFNILGNIAWRLSLVLKVDKNNYV